MDCIICELSQILKKYLNIYTFYFEVLKACIFMPEDSLPTETRTI